jgi:predicted RNase H-like nuclease (RuvC/YqgF family)
MIQAEDKTYENESRAETTQLKNIIDSKEAEITALKNVNEDYKILNEKLRKEIKKLKKEAKDMLKYP